MQYTGAGNPEEGYVVHSLGSRSSVEVEEELVGLTLFKSIIRGFGVLSFSWSLAKEGLVPQVEEPHEQKHHYAADFPRSTLILPNGMGDDRAQKKGTASFLILTSQSSRPCTLILPLLGHYISGLHKVKSSLTPQLATVLSGKLETF